MVTKISREAYDSIRESLPLKQSIVYGGVVQYGPVCSQDLVPLLGMPINALTPRMLELREQGKVIKGGEKIHPVTKRRVNLWMVAP